MMAPLEATKALTSVTEDKDETNKTGKHENARDHFGGNFTYSNHFNF